MNKYNVATPDVCMWEGCQIVAAALSIKYVDCPGHPGDDVEALRLRAMEMFLSTP